MEREATKLKTRYPLPNNGGTGIAVWEVGERRMNPDNKIDEVTHILLTEDLIIITYRDFGEEGVSKKHIDTIEFRDADYRDLQAKKKRDRKPTDTSGLAKVFNQDAGPKR